MKAFYFVTIPVGIAIKIGISNVYDENSLTTLIVEGIFNAALADILIYMSLVDLLIADFMSPKMQSKLNFQIIVNISLLLGTVLVVCLCLSWSNWLEYFVKCWQSLFQLLFPIFHSHMAYLV